MSDLHLSRRQLRGATALATVFLVSAQITPALAGPKGGIVRAGDASISTHGATTDIKQRSGKVVIEWDSFDNDVGETTLFRQPDRGSIALNRVTSEMPTNISGALEANGNVIVVNRNGVTFRNTAKVDVGGLIATTTDIENNRFMNGDLTFDKPGASDAKVINKGSITVKDAGLAALVAPDVRNSGTITAKLGTIVLAGEETFTVDLRGDGLIAFEVGKSQADIAQVTNNGTITADGGHVILQAGAASDMIDSIINTGGTVEAGSVAINDGTIVLSAGDGRINVTGELSATGAEAGQTGGEIAISAREIDVASTAKVDVSGTAGGGKIRIGGSKRGGKIVVAAPTIAPLPEAKKVRIAEGATIQADATLAGDGGDIVLWAQEEMLFFGNVFARGGSVFGDGGFAEVSGKETLFFSGKVDLSASNGVFGDLLLDPDNITISADPDAANTLNVSTLQIALNTADVTISTSNGIDDLNGEGGNGGGADDGNILINAAIEANNTAGARELTLIADNDISVNAGISEAMGSADLSLDFDADNDIVIADNVSVSVSGSIALTADADDDGTDLGTLMFGDGGSMDGGAITIDTGEAVKLGKITAISLDVNARGSITDTAGDAISVTGSTSLTAVDSVGTNFFDIALDNTTHNFDAAAADERVHAIGEQIEIVSISEANAGTITANVDASEDLTLQSSVIFLTETAASNETLVVEQGDVDLTGFDPTGGVITAPTISLTRDLPTTVNSAFANALTASQALTVRTTGTNDITVDDLTMTTPTVSFVTSSIGAGATGADVGGNIEFTSTASSFANLRVVSGGNITQDAGVTVTGTTYLLAADSTPGNTAQTITLDNAANDFQSSVDAIASGAISLRDANAIDLGLVSAGFGETDTQDTGRTLTVVAGGTISQQGPTERQIFFRGDANGSDGVTDTELDRSINAQTDYDNVLDSARIEAADGTTVTAQNTSEIDRFDILLNNANNDFDRLVNTVVATDTLVDDAIDPVDAVGEDIVLIDRDAIALGAVTATLDGTPDTNSDALTGTLPVLSGNDGDLNVAAAGSITDTDGEAINVTGSTSLTAANAEGQVDPTDAAADFFDIALDNVDTGGSAIHNFDANGDDDRVHAIGEQIEIVSISEANAGTITANVDASEDLTLQSSVIFLTETAASNETLVVEQGDVDLTGFDPTGGVITAPTISLTRDLPTTVDSAFADALTASQALTVRTTGTNDITVDGVTMTTPTVSFVTSSIGAGATGADAGGNIEFTSTASSFDNLRVVSGGNITQDAGVTATGTTYLLAADSTPGNIAQTITLDNAANDFQSSVDAIASGAISLRDANAIDLGLVSAGFGETDTQDTGRTLTVVAGGTISQQGPTERQIFFRGDANGSDGVTDTELDRSINAQTDYDNVLDSARIEAADGTTVTAQNTSEIDRFDILLNNANNDFDRLVNTVVATDTLVDDAIDPVDAVGEDIVLIDRDAIALGAVTATLDGTPDTNSDALTGTLPVLSGNDGDLNVAAAGSITDTDGEAINVTGSTSLTAANAEGQVDPTDAAADFFDIALDNVDTHNFDRDNSGDAVSAIGEDIHLDDVNSIILGNVSTNEEAVADRDATINSFSDRFNPDNADEASITPLAALGDLTVLSGSDGEAAGAITDTGTITVDGRTRLEARNSSADFDIVLDTTANNFDADGDDTPADPDATDAFHEVDAIGANITLVDTNAIALGDIRASGNLTVTAGGSITDTDRDDASNPSDSELEAINVEGTTSLTAGGPGNFFDIALDNVDTHNFDRDNSGDAVSAIGEDIHLDDVNSIILGNVSTNEEAVADRDATINSFSDRFNPDNADEASITPLAALGDLTVLSGSDGEAAGAITDTGTITVDGRTRLEARNSSADFDIVLDTTANNFDADGDDTPADPDATDAFHEVDAIGANITLVDTNAIALGDIRASGNLTVTAGGSITDTDRDDASNPSDSELEAINVEGTTSLTAGGPGNFFDIALDNVDTHNFDRDNSGDAVSAIGEDIHLDDVNSIILGNVSTNEAGQIGDGDNDANADGTIDEYDDPINTTLAASGDLTVLAGGSITDSGTINVEGRTRLEARSGDTVFNITLDDAGNDFNEDSIDELSGRSGQLNIDEHLHEIDVVGATVVITDRNDIIIGSVNADAFTATAVQDLIFKEDLYGRIGNSGVSTIEVDVGRNLQFLGRVGSSSQRVNTLDLTVGNDVLAGIANLAVGTGNAEIAFPVEFDSSIQYLTNRGNRESYFFLENLDFSGVSGGTEFLIEPELIDEFARTFSFVGIDVSNVPIPFSGERFKGFGVINTLSGREAALFFDGPRGSEFTFNTCVIGDVQDCAIQSDPVLFTPLPSEPPRLFESDTNSLFVPLGNEELWLPPARFLNDGLEDEDEQEQ